MRPGTLRFAGWACIALAKVGSLIGLWQVLRTADVGAPQASGGWPLAMLAALVFGVALLGLRLLARGGAA